MRIFNILIKGKGKKVLGKVGNGRTNETVAISEAAACGACGIALDDEPCRGYERRTKIDVVFEKVVEHIDAEVKQYPQLRIDSKREFP